MNDYQLYSHATQNVIRQLIERGQTNFSRSELLAEIAPTTDEQKVGFNWGVRTLHGKLFVSESRGNYVVTKEVQV